MRLRFWGSRGSLPVAARADTIRHKVARAVLAAGGRQFADIETALDFVDHELDFATGQGYGGATSCVEIEMPEGPFVVCDMGSGLREFGLDAIARCADGRPRDFHIFLSHLHWDHIMGLPFFAPAYDPRVTITVYAGHDDAEMALRRQQEEISFPVPFERLGATIRFVTLTPGTACEVAGLEVMAIRQFHSHDSYGYRFSDGKRSAVYSTDSEHRMDDMDVESQFEAFFGDADVVVCDTMYSLAESVTLKADWGHSSNLVAVDLCRAARAKRLVLFHHEPTASDEDLQTMHRETMRYEEIGRIGDVPLEIICAYDGLEVSV